MATFQTGETFSHQRECDRYRPIYYAGASGDFNPIHIDEEVGKSAGLGGVILQGMCTMGWAVEATVNYLGHPSKLKRFRVRFSKPVRIGDSVKFEGKVLAREGNRVRGEISATNQNGEDVLKGATFEAEV